MFSINNLLLGFKDDKIEQQFRLQYFAESIKSFRCAFLLLIIVYALFALLDLWMAPSYYLSFWFIRVVVITVMATTLLLSYDSSFQKYWQWITSFCYVIGGIGITLMLKELPTAYSYSSGLMLVFMSGMFVKLRFVYASSSSLLLLVIYNLIISTSVRDPQLILINNNFFLISANIIGLFLSYYFEKYQRKMFLNTCNLNQQKKELERANQLLEFKVKRRTESLLQKNKELMERIQKEDGKDTSFGDKTIEQEEINEMKTKYLVKIGREIRTPLNAISGFSELITAPDIEDESRLTYGNLLSKSVRQLSSISREIQVVAHLEENHRRDHFEAIPLHYFMLEIRDRVLDYFLDLESILIEEPKF